VAHQRALSLGDVGRDVRLVHRLGMGRTVCLRLWRKGQVYYGDEAVATAEEYATQAETIATTPAEAPPADTDWMPLGVFAITQDGQASGPAPTMFVQLIVNKNGTINGTFTNTAVGNESQSLEGMVDKKSQRAAWVLSGKKRPIMETGIFNLTKETSPALVHFEDGQTQQWLLVRMDEPKEAASQQTPPQQQPKQ
jgi:hypothetical protein